MGDAIFANVLVLGAAWQAGGIPISRAAIQKAIELNGAGVDGNLKAFEIGRWAYLHPDQAEAAVAKRRAEATTYEEKIAYRHERLVAWGNAAWADRWMKSVRAAEAAEAKIPGAGGFAETAALGLHKLMTYKDEYEVARLHLETLETQVAERFDNVRRIEFHLAPPILGRKDNLGRPVKSSFGPWVMRLFGLLARMKPLRGGAFDVFGYTEERREERKAIEDQEALLSELCRDLKPETHAIAVELAGLPLQVKGFGHVKAANAEAAARRREELIAMFRAGGAPAAQAAE